MERPLLFDRHFVFFRLAGILGAWSIGLEAATNVEATVWVAFETCLASFFIFITSFKMQVDEVI